MKITLTLFEAKQLVIQALNLPVDTFVDFLTNFSPEFVRILDVLSPFMVGHLTFHPDKKIAAIHALRKANPDMGLFDAKQFVMNQWPKSIEFVNVNNRLPKFDATTGNMS